MLTRRQFGFAAALQERRRPNVLFLLCDQWRRQTELIAPHLDRLKAEGVEFTRAYVANPVCAPSRAALQTGRYPHAVSMQWNGLRLPLEYPCLADAFAEAGYKTGYIGKWHLDGGEDPGYTPPGPRRRSYQYWAAFNHAHSYFDFLYFLDDAKGVKASGYEPDHQTGLALEFIRKNQGGPFLLFVSFGPPHGPYRPPERHAATYKPESIPLRENVPAAFEAAARKTTAAYYGLCSSIDDNVGRMLQALDEFQIASNTVVVFTGDHGDMLYSHGLEDKKFWYEESAGVPLLMRWPGQLAAGTKQDWLFNNIDIAPTLRGLCGLPPIEGAHGEDRSALIRNRGAGERPESIYAQGELGSPREWRMVVRGWDKLVVDRELKVTHLYNLAQDPLEKDNLAGDRGTIRRQEELAALIRRWIIKTGDRVPFPGRRNGERNGIHERKD